MENAVDFARSRVDVLARWDPEEVVLTIADDRPGFAPEIMDRIGEPYVTSRGERGTLAGGEMSGARARFFYRQDFARTLRGGAYLRQPDASRSTAPWWGASAGPGAISSRSRRPPRRLSGSGVLSRAAAGLSLRVDRRRSVGGDRNS